MLKSKNKQSGVVLAIGMILLLIISVIGITSMKSAILQHKMSGALKNKEISDSVALTLLAAGEQFLYTYYQNSNNTILSPGTSPIVEPRSDLVHRFKNERNLNEGYLHPFDIKLSNNFTGGLKDEPRLIIEDLEDAYNLVNGTSYLVAEGEFDDGSTGSNSGQNGDNGAAYGGVEVKKYRITSKATDASGLTFAGFESVISVVVR